MSPPRQMTASPGVHGKSFERAHQCLGAGEIHRPLRMGNGRHREREKRWCQHPRGLVDALSGEAFSPPIGEPRIELEFDLH